MADQVHLVVTTPCFGGQVSSIYAGAIFQLQRAVRSRPNIDLTVLLRDGDALITRGRANLVTLFLDNPTRTYLSEDFAFCKRWTDIGGEIWADLESRLDHVGPPVFHGDVSSQFAPAARAANAA